MSEKSLRQRTISGMIWVGVQKFGTLIITFLSNIVLARLLTPDDYGMVGMLAIFIAISNAFIDGGFGSALIQKTSPTQQDYTTVFYWNIFLSVTIYTLLYLTAPLIENFYHNITGLAQILRVQGVVLIINAITIVQFNQLRKAMRFKLLAKINIYSASISVVCAIALAYLGFGVWALVYQQIILSVANCILLWICCRWKPVERFSLRSLKELFSFGSFMMLSSLVNTLGVNINGLLIGKFFSSGTLGYYTQAKKLEDVSSIGLLSVVEQVTYPMLVEVKDDYTKMSNVLAKFNSGVLALTMPLLYALALMALPVIVFLFSDKWIPSAPILQVLAIHGILIVMQGATYNAIAAIGLSKVLFRWTIIKRISGILLCVGLLLLFEFDGLLWGIVLSAALITFCNMYLVAKYISYKLSDQIKSMMPVILISTIPFLIFFIIENFIHIDNDLLLDCLCGFAYLLSYILILLFLPTTSVSQLRKDVLAIVRRK